MSSVGVQQVSASAPIADLIIRTTVLVWSPPTERFVMYEESDEEWCQYFGIGELKYSSYSSTIRNLAVVREEYDSVRQEFRVELVKGRSAAMNEPPT